MGSGVNGCCKFIIRGKIDTWKYIEIENSFKLVEIVLNCNKI